MPLCCRLPCLIQCAPVLCLGETASVRGGTHPRLDRYVFPEARWLPLQERQRAAAEEREREAAARRQAEQEREARQRKEREDNVCVRRCLPWQISRKHNFLDPKWQVPNAAQMKAVLVGAWLPWWHV